MAKQDKSEELAPHDKSNEGLGSKTPPQPPASAANLAGGIGPGALAAAEASIDSERGLTPGEIETLRRLVRRAGGRDALIRILDENPDMK